MKTKRNFICTCQIPVAGHLVYSGSVEPDQSYKVVRFFLKFRHKRSKLGKSGPVKTVPTVSVAPALNSKKLYLTVWSGERLRRENNNNNNNNIYYSLPF